jgi:hypothetical protein
MRAPAFFTLPWTLVTADGDRKLLLEVRVASVAGSGARPDFAVVAAEAVPDESSTGIEDRAAAPPTAPMKPRREGPAPG